MNVEQRGRKYSLGVAAETVQGRLVIGPQVTNLPHRAAEPAAANNGWPRKIAGLQRNQVGRIKRLSTV